MHCARCITLKSAAGQLLPCNKKTGSLGKSHAGQQMFQVSSKHVEKTVFLKTSAVKREDIVNTFHDMKAKLERAERLLLEQFDASVRGTVKLLDAEMEALDVSRNQLAATMVMANEVPALLCNELVTSLPRAFTRRVASVVPGLSLLQKVLDACLKNGVGVVKNSADEITAHVKWEQSLLSQFVVLDAARFEARNTLGNLRLLHPRPCGVPIQARKKIISVDVDTFGCGAGSPDGLMFAVAERTSAQCRIMIYNVMSRAKIRWFGKYGKEPGNFNCISKICFSSAETLLVSEDNNKRVQEVTVAGNHVRFIGTSVFTRAVISVDCNVGSNVIVASQTDLVFVFELGSGMLLRRFCSPGVVSPIRDVVISTSGNLIAIGSVELKLCIRTLDDRPVATLGDHHTVEKVCFVSETEVLAMGEAGRYFEIFSTKTGCVVREFCAPKAFSVFMLLDKLCLFHAKEFVVFE